MGSIIPSGQDLGFRVAGIQSGFRVGPEFCFLILVQIAIIKEAKPDIAAFLETIALTV